MAIYDTSRIKAYNRAGGARGSMDDLFAEMYKLAFKNAIGGEDEKYEFNPVNNLNLLAGNYSEEYNIDTISERIQDIDSYVNDKLKKRKGDIDPEIFNAADSLKKDMDRRIKQNNKFTLSVNTISELDGQISNELNNYINIKKSSTEFSPEELNQQLLSSSNKIKELQLNQLNKIESIGTIDNARLYKNKNLQDQLISSRKRSEASNHMMFTDGMFDTAEAEVLRAAYTFGNLEAIENFYKNRASVSAQFAENTTTELQNTISSLDSVYQEYVSNPSAEVKSQFVKLSQQYYNHKKSLINNVGYGMTKNLIDDMTGSGSVPWASEIDGDFYGTTKRKQLQVPEPIEKVIPAQLKAEAKADSLWDSGNTYNGVKYEEYAPPRKGSDAMNVATSLGEKSYNDVKAKYLSANPSVSFPTEYRATNIQYKSANKHLNSILDKYGMSIKDVSKYVASESFNPASESTLQTRLQSYLNTKNIDKDAMDILYGLSPSLYKMQPGIVSSIVGTITKAPGNRIVARPKNSKSGIIEKAILNYKTVGDYENLTILYDFIAQELEK